MSAGLVISFAVAGDFSHRTACCTFAQGIRQRSIDLRPQLPIGRYHIMFTEDELNASGQNHTKHDGFCTKHDGFVLKLMNFVLKLMDFVLKMMEFVLKMMDFVLKMMSPMHQWQCGRRNGRLR